MKALVAVRSSPHRIEGDDSGLETYGWDLDLADRVAVEAGLRTAETTSVVGVGGDRARTAIRSALRMGADEGHRVAFDPVDATAGAKFAEIVAEMTVREAADLVVVGETAPLMGAEVVGTVGETLGWTACNRVREIGREAVDADVGGGRDGEGNVDDERGLALQRRVESGRHEILTVDPPAVLGVDRRFANPRRAPLDAVVEGQQAAVETVPLERVAPDENRFSACVGDARVERVTPNDHWGSGAPPRGGAVEGRILEMLGRDEEGSGSAGEVVDAPPEEAAERVVAYLRENELL